MPHQVHELVLFISNAAQPTQDTQTAAQEPVTGQPTDQTTLGLEYLLVCSSPQTLTFPQNLRQRELIRGWKSPWG